MLMFAIMLALYPTLSTITATTTLTWRHASKRAPWRHSVATAVDRWTLVFTSVSSGMSNQLWSTEKRHTIRNTNFYFGIVSVTLPDFGKTPLWIAMDHWTVARVTAVLNSAFETLQLRRHGISFSRSCSFCLSLWIRCVPLYFQSSVFLLLIQGKQRR